MQKTVSHTLKILILLQRVKTSKLDIIIRENIQLTAVQEKISTSYCSCKLFVVSCEENHLFGAITSGEVIDRVDGWHDGGHDCQNDCNNDR